MPWFIEKDIFCNLGDFQLAAILIIVKIMVFLQEKSNINVINMFYLQLPFFRHITCHGLLQNKKNQFGGFLVGGHFEFFKFYEIARLYSTILFLVIARTLYNKKNLGSNLLQFVLG